MFKSKIIDLFEKKSFDILLILYFTSIEFFLEIRYNEILHEFKSDQVSYFMNSKKLLNSKDVVKQILINLNP